MKSCTKHYQSALEFLSLRSPLHFSLHLHLLVQQMAAIDWKDAIIPFLTPGVLQPKPWPDDFKDALGLDTDRDMRESAGLDQPCSPVPFSDHIIDFWSSAIHSFSVPSRSPRSPRPAETTETDSRAPSPPSPPSTPSPATTPPVSPTSTAPSSTSLSPFFLESLFGVSTFHSRVSVSALTPAPEPTPEPAPRTEKQSKRNHVKRSRVKGTKPKKQKKTKPAKPKKPRNPKHKKATQTAPLVPLFSVEPRSHSPLSASSGEDTPDHPAQATPSTHPTDDTSGDTSGDTRSLTVALSRPCKCIGECAITQSSLYLQKQLDQLKEYIRTGKDLINHSFRSPWLSSAIHDHKRSMDHISKNIYIVPRTINTLQVRKTVKGTGYPHFSLEYRCPMPLLYPHCAIISHKNGALLPRMATNPSHTSHTSHTSDPSHPTPLAPLAPTAIVTCARTRRIHKTMCSTCLNTFGRLAPIPHRLLVPLDDTGSRILFFRVPEQVRDSNPCVCMYPQFACTCFDTPFMHVSEEHFPSSGIPVSSPYDTKRLKDSINERRGHVMNVSTAREYLSYLIGMLHGYTNDVYSRDMRDERRAPYLPGYSDASMYYGTTFFSSLSDSYVTILGLALPCPSNREKRETYYFVVTPDNETATHVQRSRPGCFYSWSEHFFSNTRDLELVACTGCSLPRCILTWNRERCGTDPLLNQTAFSLFCLCASSPFRVHRTQQDTGYTGIPFTTRRKRPSTTTSVPPQHTADVPAAALPSAALPFAASPSTPLTSDTVTLQARVLKSATI